jgi:hypothetical protein
MIVSAQECVDALERGIPLTLHDGSILKKRPSGEYVWLPGAPESLAVEVDNSLTSFDLESLLLVVLLRDAEITPVVVEADRSV